MSLSVNQNLPTKAASDNHHLTRPPLLILIDAPFPSRLSRYSKIVRTIGLARAKFKIGMMNLSYNISRLVQLERIAAAPA